MDTRAFKMGFRSDAWRAKRSQERRAGWWERKWAVSEAILFFWKLALAASWGLVVISTHPS